MKIAVFFFSFLIPPALCVVLNVKPEVSSIGEIQAVRTTTTVTLTKPICVFTNGTIVDVFGVQASVSSIPNEIDNSNIRSYQQTRGGATGPYRAASFDMPDCTSMPFVLSTNPAKIQTQINEYLFRVGNDVRCLKQINNPPENCNAPLAAGRMYRFKYAVRNGSANVFFAETLWSDSITLLQASELSALAAASRRTGGMVVITVILVILLFLLLGAFVALLMYIFCLKKEMPAIEQQPPPARYITHKKNPGFNPEGTKAAAQSSPGRTSLDQHTYQSTVETAQVSG